MVIWKSVNYSICMVVHKRIFGPLIPSEVLPCGVIVRPTHQTGTARSIVDVAARSPVVAHTPRCGNTQDTCLYLRFDTRTRASPSTVSSLCAIPLLLFLSHPNSRLEQVRRTVCSALAWICLISLIEDAPFVEDEDEEVDGCGRNDPTLLLV